VQNSHNFECDGYTCTDTLEEIDEMLNVFKSEWVVMMCGENDLMDSSVVETYPRFQQIVSKIVATGARVITLGTKPEPDTGELHEKYQRYDSLVWQLASTLAASNAGSPPLLVMINTYLSFVTLGNPDSLYANDCLHLADN